LVALPPPSVVSSVVNTDLLFLDIQMPKLDGFEVLELLDPAPAVIFVTAYDEFALRAFEIGDYVQIVSGKQRLLKQETLSDLETLLDAQRFVRIHRSFILNVERMEKLEPYTKDSRVAILRDGTSLPVSKTGYGRLRELL
jgi:two-component system LytT family response regulator